MTNLNIFFNGISKSFVGFKNIEYYRIVWLFFTVLSAFIVADVSNRFIEWKLLSGYTGFHAEIKTPTPPRRRSLLEIIAQDTIKSKTKPVKQVAVPPFKLVGMVNGKGGPSYAFFEDPDKRRQFLVKEGDTVSEGVLLKSVDDDKAILSVGKREFTLYIEYKKDEKKTAYHTSRPARAKAEPEAAGSVISRREVENSLKNLNVVMTQARVIPYMIGGESKGYRVFAIRPQSIYTKIGLKNGDVIQRVNGVELNSPDKAYYLFQQLKNEKKITLDILRRGKKVSIPIEVN